MSSVIAKLLALILAHSAPEPATVIPVHTPKPAKAQPAYRYIEGERVPLDHDEDDHEDDDGWQHNSEECESW